MQLAPYKPLPATTLFPAPLNQLEQPEQHQQPVASTSRLPVVAKAATSARKPDSKGKGKATASRRASSHAPMYGSTEELNKARLAATSRLASTWADIAHRHQTLLPPSSSSGAGWLLGGSRWLPEEEDDIIDLETMEIVQDRGVLRGTKAGALRFGGEGSWSDHSDSSSDDEGKTRAALAPEEDDSEDELGLFDQLESLPSQSFRDQRRAKEAERLHLLEFTMQETKARQMRASAMAGGTVDGVDDEEWERTKRELERASGNEVLEAPAGAVGKPEDGASEEEDDFAAFEVTPTTARTLPKSQGARSAATPASSAAQRRGKAAAPPSTTRLLRKGLRKVDLKSSPPTARRQSESSPAKLSLSSSLSYGLRSSVSATDLDSAAMPPPPRPSTRVVKSRSLPNNLSRPPSSSSPLTIAAKPSSSSPKRAPSVARRGRRESTFFLDFEVPIRRSVTPAARREPSVVPGPPAAFARKSKPAPTPQPSSSMQTSPLKQVLPPSPSPDLDEPTPPPRRITRARRESLSLGKRARVSDPIVLELSDSDPEESLEEDQAHPPVTMLAPRRIGLATPPNSKGSSSSSPRRSSSGSPAKKQRRSLSPLKQSIHPSASRQALSPHSSGIFDLTKSAAALAVATPRPSTTPRPPSPARRRGSGSPRRSPRRTTKALPRLSPRRDVFSNPTPASEEEDEDELLLTAASARDSPLKPEGVEQSLEGIRLGAQGMGLRRTRSMVDKGWEVLDLTGDSDDELDLLRGS